MFLYFLGFLYALKLGTYIIQTQENIDWPGSKNKKFLRVSQAHSNFLKWMHNINREVKKYTFWLQEAGCCTRFFAGVFKSLKKIFVHEDWVFHQECFSLFENKAWGSWWEAYILSQEIKKMNLWKYSNFSLSYKAVFWTDCILSFCFPCLFIDHHIMLLYRVKIFTSHSCAINKRTGFLFSLILLLQ